MSEIEPHHRAQALAELRAMEAELGQMAGWLDRNGYEWAAVLLEDPQRSLLAAQALIDRDSPHGAAQAAEPGRMTGRLRL